MLNEKRKLESRHLDSYIFLPHLQRCSPAFQSERLRLFFVGNTMDAAQEPPRFAPQGLPRKKFIRGWVGLLLLAVCWPLNWTLPPANRVAVWATELMRPSRSL